LLLILPVPFISYLIDERLAVGKEAFVSRAKEIQSFFAIVCPYKAIFGTFSIAHNLNLTFPTIAGQEIQLGFPESSLFRTLEEFDKRSFDNIPETVFVVHKVVTRIEVSVVFDNGNISADRPKDA
jgi:hypothetical protein